MANPMLLLVMPSTHIQTLVQLKDSSHVHQGSVGDVEASEGSRERQPTKMESLVPCVPMGMTRSGQPREPCMGVRNQKIKENFFS
jgi:hypothetical protein